MLIGTHVEVKTDYGRIGRLERREAIQLFPQRCGDTACGLGHAAAIAIGVPDKGSRVRSVLSSAADAACRCAHQTVVDRRAQSLVCGNITGQDHVHASRVQIAQQGIQAAGNRVEVGSVGDFTTAVSKVRRSDTVLLRVLRESRVFYVVLKPTDP